MPKSITRTVLAFASTNFPTGYDSGPLDVGDLSELYINSSGASVFIFAVDANGALTPLAPNYSGGQLSLGAGFSDNGSLVEEQHRSDEAFGNTIRVQASGNVTISLSIEGK